MPAEPSAQLMGVLLGPVYAAAVAAVARFGIPDLLADGPKTAESIAAATGAKADLLYRLMRATEAVGVLRRAANGMWEQTELSALLRTDGPETLRDLAIYWSDDWRTRAVAAMHKAVLTGENAVELTYGMGPFEYLKSDPEAGLNFNRAMTSFSTTEVAAILEAYDFSAFGSLVEIAGGHGLFLSAILESAPRLTATLLELPQVLAEMSETPLRQHADRVSIVGGDMFSAVPAGGDAYLMKRIIHDWPDETAGMILSACREAVNPGGKLLVIDAVVPEGPGFSTTKFLDVTMMIFSGGKERTAAEFRRLYAANGWKLERIVPTASPMCIIEGVPA
jgi:hypothetical protein